jgi:hypothetical protein
MKANQPVPVQSCWNGVGKRRLDSPPCEINTVFSFVDLHLTTVPVAFDASPFYNPDPLRFRGIPDSLALHHLEGSECCLIHADNPQSASKGLWLNPNVRIGYDANAYSTIHTIDL